jgi:hypothetical protein
MKKSPNVRAEVIPALSKNLAPSFPPKNLFIEVHGIRTRTLISQFSAPLRAYREVLSFKPPHIRPIVARKKGKSVEFGAKLSASCFEGYVFFDG